MSRALMLLLACICLASCKSQTVADLEATDAATCKSAPDYEACRARLLVYRQQEAARPSMGDALQRAGAALRDTPDTEVLIIRR